MDIDTINRMSANEFVRAFGGVFEHSAWVAEHALAARPFADIDALHAAMVAVVRSAPREEQIALLNAHPDLAGREAEEGTMTDASVAEQSSAGLDALSAAEVARIAELNARYRERHGFPFIIAVRHYTKAGIFHEFEHRLHEASDVELAAALRQVFAITRLRLERLCDSRQGAQA
jgi:2-oxo-4-hydroxy-4-carboxy-5-ureidoimidazoline decarboxylase